MSTIAKLIKEYSAGAYQLQQYRKSLDMQNPLQTEIDSTVGDMIADMRYSIEWMRLGRRPGSRRGVERTDIYRQREIYTELQPMTIDDAERKRLVMMLLSLTERERVCFLLHMAQGLTYSEIGSILNVSKATAQKFVARAKGKVQQGITG